MHKKIILICCILYCSFTYGQTDSIMHDGIMRTFWVHTPPSYDGSQSFPLIIAMHGGFGSGDQLENQSLLSEKADDADFIVVYPDGVSSPLGIRTWNAGVCCGYAANNDIDDVGFINNLIDQLSVDYNIDTNKIYATGMSNGGYMSYRLACELSNKIAAIAPVAASYTVEGPCTPERPVPLIHFHSILDSNVMHIGGKGQGVSNHYSPPLDSVFEVWRTLNNCDLPETVQDNDEFLFMRWLNGDCNSEIHYYLTTDGGHSWPGGVKTIVGDSVSTVIIANDLMWNFFQNYSLKCDSDTINSIISHHKKIEIIIYPNPSTDIIMLDGVANGAEVKVFSIQGKLIFSKPLITRNLNLERLNPGIYILEIHSKGKNSSFKIIKE